MHLQISLVVFAICSALFCLTNAAPVGEQDTGETSKKRKLAGKFSPQEDEFIREQVLLQAQAYDVTSWVVLAKEFERKFNNKDLGFNQARSAEGIRKHFNRSLRHDLPTWKPKMSTHTHKLYTEQEEELINKELVKNSYRMKYLYTDDMWQAIQEEHNLKREQKCEGFPHERSRVALRAHFKHSMRPGRRVSKQVMARFPKNFRSQEESTSGSSKTVGEEIHPDHDTDPSENTTSGGLQRATT